MPTFKLINPLILGNLDTEFKGKNASSVAPEAWDAMSKHFTGNVPRFGFTLQGPDNDLHHYLVKERIKKDKEVDYSLEPLDVKMTEQQERNFANHIGKLKSKINEQTGGRRKRRYEDDDDSDNDDYLRNKLTYYRSNNHPFYYWWYNPMIYTLYGTNYNSIYIPTFSIPFYPYFEVDVSSAFFA